MSDRTDRTKSGDVKGARAFMDEEESTRLRAVFIFPAEGRKGMHHLSLRDGNSTHSMRLNRPELAELYERLGGYLADLEQEDSDLIVSARSAEEQVETIEEQADHG